MQRRKATNGKARAGGRARPDQCPFCRLAELLEREKGRQSGVFEHLANAKREVLQAVREFVDNELDVLEQAIRSRRRRGAGRMRRIPVED